MGLHAYTVLSRYAEFLVPTIAVNKRLMNETPELAGHMGVKDTLCMGNQCKARREGASGNQGSGQRHTRSTQDRDIDSRVQGISNAPSPLQGAQEMVYPKENQTLLPTCQNSTPPSTEATSLTVPL